MNALIVCGYSTDETRALLRRIAPGFDMTIAADGGAALLQDVGITPTAIVGDMDSLDPRRLEDLAVQGAYVQRHSPRKDVTDLDLCLDYVRGHGVREVAVIGATGGRLDHTLAAIGSVAAATDLIPKLVDPGLRGYVLDTVHRPRLTLSDVGGTVSILAIGGAASVASTGLRWPLDGLELEPLSSHGVSNIVESVPASIEVGEGIVLVTCMRDD